MANKILTSEKLNAIDEGSENLFYHLLVLVDDFGRYYANPKIVRSYCYPLREVHLDEITRRMESLESIGLIYIYKNNGEIYLEIVEFEKYQKFRSDIKRKEDFPEPTEVGDEPDTSRIESDTDCNEGESTVNRNRSNNKGENGNEYPTEFESFWEKYPNHKQVQDAYDSWKELNKTEKSEVEIAAENYAIECINNKEELKYIKHGSSFCRKKKRRWKDYLKPIEPIRKVGESRLPEKTPDEKKSDDDYVEARIKKEDELKKKYNYSKIDTIGKMEDVDAKIQNELAKWYKGYYAKGKN